MKGGKKGQSKKEKLAGIYREVVASNVRKLLDHQFREHKTSTARIKALAKISGIWPATIQRILAQESGATLDNLEALAIGLDVQPYQLVLPNLDEKNPQIVQGAQKSEEAFYRRARRADAQTN